MAIVKGVLQLSGSVRGVSFYTVQGSDQVIMRTKGGATKEKIAKAPQFEGLRKQQKEWSGCTKFGSIVRYTFGGLHRLADYNLTPVLNGIAKNIQKCDLTGVIGQRSILLSQCKEMLSGFNFNRNYPFNTVLRVSPTWQIDREALQATVSIPRIQAETDVMNIQRLPYFRLITALGTVSDMQYDAQLNDYKPIVTELHGVSATLTGEWHSAQSIVAEHQLIVQIDPTLTALLTDSVSVVLSMGIEFGTSGFTDEIVAVKHAGCGKTLAVR